MNNSDANNPQQIPLPFNQFQSLEFANFVLGNNENPVQLVEAVATGSKEERLYLWGAEGTGKSHLLQAACKQATDRERAVAYLPLKLLHNQSAEAIDGLENYDLIAIDDIEYIAGDRHWEEALLHLYNRIKNQAGSLIISSRENPLSSSVQLADLHSRLSWGLEYRLLELNDVDKGLALQQAARQRGFELADDVVNYLITRVDRNIGQLMVLLDTIDKHSMIEKRKITIPLIKDILN